MAYKTHETVSAKINTIRAKALGVTLEALLDEHTCPTCVRPAAAPYRRRSAGSVSEGCVDAHHQGHADAWHSRKQAYALRAAELASLSCA